MMEERKWSWKGGPSCPSSPWTSSSLTSILRQRYSPALQISSVQAERIPHGFMSVVLKVQISYDDGMDSSASLSTEAQKEVYPRYLLSKSLLIQEGKDDDKNMMRRIQHGMLVNEVQFYTEVAPRLMAHERKSFLVPRLMHVSESKDAFLLEYIPKAQCIPLPLGCPSDDMVRRLLSHLANLHASQWRFPERNHAIPSEELPNTPPGIGASLSSTDKVHLVQKHYLSYLNALKSQISYDSSRTALEQFLQWPALNDVHRAVYAVRYTLVHGDFHIANWLLRSEREEDAKNHPGDYLVDWGCSGIGNPICDFVFFLLVSTRINVLEIEHWLRYYYDRLTSYSNLIANMIPYNQCRHLMRLCLLNQLLIFIAHDPMVRDSLVGAKDHVDRVHSRAIQVILTPFMDYKSLIQEEKHTTLSVKFEKKATESDVDNDHGQ